MPSPRATETRKPRLVPNEPSLSNHSSCEEPGFTNPVLKNVGEEAAYFAEMGLDQKDTAPDTKRKWI